MVGSQPIRINEGKSYSPIPEDKYQVQVSDVEAIVMMNSFKGIEEERLKYQFTILDPDKTMPGDKTLGEAETVNLRGRKLWSRLAKVLSTPGATKASHLTKLVTAVYGRELEKAELAVFEPEDLIGKQLSVMVNQEASKKDGTIYNNIISYSKATGQMEAWVEDEKSKKPAVRKSEPAIAQAPEDFEKEMDAEVAKRNKK